MRSATVIAASAVLLIASGCGGGGGGGGAKPPPAPLDAEITAISISGTTDEDASVVWGARTDEDSAARGHRFTVRLGQDGVPADPRTTVAPAVVVDDTLTATDAAGNERRYAVAVTVEP